MEEAGQGAAAASLARATPEQIRELQAALGQQQNLLRHREQYLNHLAALPTTGPQHLNSLASLEAQLEDAQQRTEAAFKAVYGSVRPRVSEDEVDRLVQEYLASRKNNCT
ncbi:MAG TPA: hypothetical protein VFA26_00640 [Gemmataceae bacterium]|nr:hypothetical protein [Gemmataceae bacterium]